jgi:hypothetical protein
MRESLEQASGHHRRGEAEEADQHSPGLSPRPRPRRGVCLLGRLQRRPGLLEERLAGRGDGDAAGVALEQPDADLRLEPRDRL